MMGRKLNALFVGKPIWPRDKFPEHEVSSIRLSRKKQKRKAWRQRRLLRSSNLLCPETMVASFHRNDDAKVFNWHGAENFPSLHSRRDNSQRNRVVDWSKYLEALFHCPSTWGSVQVTTPKVTSPITIQLLRFVAEKMRKATPTSSAALKSGSSFFLAWPAGFISWEQGGAGPTWRNFTWHTQFTVLCLLL